MRRRLGRADVPAVENVQHHEERGVVENRRAGTDKEDEARQLPHVQRALRSTSTNGHPVLPQGSGLGPWGQPRCFNEAATNSSRKSNDTRWGPYTGSGFNEAATNSSRKCGVEYESQVARKASMRPRRIRRGNLNILRRHMLIPGEASMRPRRIRRGNPSGDSSILSTAKASMRPRRIRRGTTNCAPPGP